MFNREPLPTRSGQSRLPWWGTLTMSAALVVTAALVEAPTSASAQQGAVSPRSLAPPLATVTPATPHAVPPAVHALAVPPVLKAERDRVVAKTTTAAPTVRPHTSLVAHLRTRVAAGFSMIGVTWTQASVEPAAVDVTVRSRVAAGWSDWTPLDVDPDEGPSAAEESSVRDGTAPLFVGDADAVEVAVYSTQAQPQQLQVDAIDPGTSSYDAAATATVAGDGTLRDGFPAQPRIVTRKGWGADESLGNRCWSPRYGTTFKAVFVHHTAGSNSYSRSESAAVVRGIYAYHTISRGWCDIGYNFLVDRYGTVYEGRDGGIRRPVRGAHAGDYNVDSTGISLMGTFETVFPTRAMRKSLVSLISWRMGTAYHGGYGRAWIEGKRFQRISGHRDAMSTSCPGQRVYDWLPKLRRRVENRLDHFHSRIKDRWIKVGGQASALGPVRVGEVIEHQGHHTTFQDGRMYSSSYAGRHTLRPSPLLRKYLKAGETDGRMGYPVSDVGGPNNGLTADFEGGAIYWSPGTGSRILLRGHVLRRYRAEGAAKGKLGFPETAVRATKAGTHARFQHGTITYTKSTQQTTVTYE